MFRSRLRCGCFSRLPFPMHLLLCSRIGFPFIAIEWPERFVVNIDVRIDVTSLQSIRTALFVVDFTIRDSVPREAYGCRTSPAESRPRNWSSRRRVRFTFHPPPVTSLNGRRREVIEVLLRASGSRPVPFIPRN